MTGKKRVIARDAMRKLGETSAARGTKRSAATVYSVIRAAATKFLADNCLVRANSIAYAIVISIIPLLTILVKVANIDQHTIVSNVSTFLAAYGMTETTELTNILNEILERSQTIAVVGFIFMVYSATNLLRNLEDAFNYIYRSRKNRPLVYRFAFYIASFVVLPVLAITSVQAARYMLNQVRPSSFTDTLTRDETYVLGGNGVIRVYDEGQNEARTIHLQEKARFDAPQRDVFFDLNTRKSGPTWQIAGDTVRVPEIEIADLYALNDIEAFDDYLFVISSTGLLLYSNDRGNTWQHFKLAFKVDAETFYNPRFSDLHALEETGELVIVVTLASKSGLVFYRPRAVQPWRYVPLPSIFDRIHEIENVDPEGIGYYRNGLYLTGRGRYIYTPNYFRYMSPVREARFANSSVDITTMQANAEGDMYFGGSGGSFWIDTPAGPIYPDTRATFDQGVTGFQIAEDGRGFLYGRNGLFRYTEDYGRTWLRTDQSIFNSATFLTHVSLPDDVVLLAGEDELLMRWQGVDSSQSKFEENGLRVVHLNYDTLLSYPLLKSAMQRITVSVFGFSVIFLIFWLGYLFIPNARVQWVPAAVGGVITAVSLLAFIIGFRVFLAFSSTTAFIYGVWAAIPLGMIVILVSTQIILFGLEVSYVLQHPYLYRRVREKTVEPEAQDEGLMWNALVLLALVYHWLYEEKQPLTDEEAVKYFDEDADRLEFTRDRLLAEKALAYDPSEGEYFPTRPPNEVSIAELQNSILAKSTAMPDYVQDTDNPFFKKVNDMNNRIHALLDRDTGPTSISDFLPLLRDEKTHAALRGGQS